MSALEPGGLLVLLAGLLIIIVYLLRMPRRRRLFSSSLIIKAMERFTRRERRKLRTILSFVAVFLAAGGQTGWALRPYLVRPQTEGVPFLRNIEGGFADAVYRSTRSAAGVYDVAEREIIRSAESTPDWIEPEPIYEPAYGPSYDDGYDHGNRGTYR